MIWWRDIPAQVVATHADETVRVELPARFVQAIDRAAMRGGMVGSDAYLEQWVRRARPCGEDLGQRSTPRWSGSSRTTRRRS